MGKDIDFHNKFILLNQSYEYYSSSNGKSNAISISRNFTQDDKQNFFKHNEFEYQSSNSSYLVDQNNSNDTLRSPKPSFSENGKETLSISSKICYGESKYSKQGVTDDLLNKIFKKLNDAIFYNNISILNERQLSRGRRIPVSVFDIKFGKPIEVVRESPFCNYKFMKMRNELINVYGIRKYNIASTTPSDLSSECIQKYCDFSYIHMKDNCNQVQRESLVEIYNKLRSLPEAAYFKLISFPLLTQFNVEVLSVLRQIFRLVIFEAPNQLILYHMERDKWHLWRDKLLKLTEVNTPWRSVVSFLPDSCITDSDSDNHFYNWLVEVNNSRLYHEINRVMFFRPRT